MYGYGRRPWIVRLRSGCVVMMLAVICGAVVVALPLPAMAAPTSQDRTFATENAQTDLAEISLAAIAAQRAEQPSTKALGQKTAADHRAALAKLTAIAQKEGFSLPTAPNAQELAVAATLKRASSSSFDLAYASAQVAGHVTSIAQTQTEISTGSDAALLSYARYYLPIAQTHLQMASAAVRTLGGSVPNSVPAGTGGQRAATDSRLNEISVAEMSAGATLLLLALAGLGLLWRRDQLGR